MAQTQGPQTCTLGSSPLVIVPLPQTSFLERRGLSGEKGGSVGRPTGLCVRGEGGRRGGGEPSERSFHHALVGCCQNPRAPPRPHRLPLPPQVWFNESSGQKQTFSIDPENKGERDARGGREAAASVMVPGGQQSIRTAKAARAGGSARREAGGGSAGRAGGGGALRHVSVSPAESPALGSAAGSRLPP